MISKALSLVGVGRNERVYLCFFILRLLQGLYLLLDDFPDDCWPLLVRQKAIIVFLSRSINLEKFEL